MHKVLKAQRNQAVRIIQDALLCLVAIAAGGLCSSCKHASSGESLDQLAARGRPELLRYYESQPDRFKGDDLWVIGRCYFDEGKFEHAKQAFQEYTACDPTNPKGWFALGNTCFVLEQWNEAIPYFEKADLLGKHEAVRMTAASCAAAGNYQHLRELVPKLRRYVEDLPDTSDDRFEIVGIAVSAAINSEPPDKALFDQFVGYLPEDRSTWREDIRECVVKGFEKFGSPDKFRQNE